MSASTQTAAALGSELLAHLTGARWFAGKGRRAELVRRTPLPWLSAPGAWPAVRSEVVEVRYSEPGHDPSDAGSATAGEAELYQLCLSYYPKPQPELRHAEIGRLRDGDLGDVLVYDAMQDPQACRLVLQRLIAAHGEADRDGALVAANGSRVDFHPVEAAALTGDLVPRTHPGEQSNTSVMFGDVAMLKLFRRLEVGHNLDIEVHEALSRSGNPDVARLYGWVEGCWPAEPGSSPGAPQLLSADLAMVVEKLAEAEDGWELALDSLRTGQDLREHAAALGRALAEIHDALRRQFGGTMVSGAAVAERMAHRLDAAARVAPPLDEHVDGLRRCFAALGQATLATQRVHGDFHLGQTLCTPGGWKIIDFEGEPVKTLAERAAPDSVWRDVAGMLRSFDYAAASVPGAASRAWADGCRSAFLQGYAGGGVGATEQAVLWAYLADKAVYEVVYEVRNRPDWVHIPLGALEAIASATSTAALACAPVPTAPAERTKE